MFTSLLVITYLEVPFQRHVGRSFSAFRKGILPLKVYFCSPCELDAPTRVPPSVLPTFLCSATTGGPHRSQVILWLFKRWIFLSAYFAIRCVRSPPPPGELFDPGLPGDDYVHACPFIGGNSSGPLFFQGHPANPFQSASWSGLFISLGVTPFAVSCLGGAGTQEPWLPLSFPVSFFSSFLA